MVWWWPAMLGTTHKLPQALGPYVPGWGDVMTGKNVDDGLLVRIYYPTSLDKSQDHSDKWAPWLPHRKYLRGFADVLGLWTILMNILYSFVSGVVKLPAAVHAPIAKDPPKLKTAVFSHGMGGTRFLYSGICCELAAHGYVVAAVEHRDQSAATTWYCRDGDKTKQQWLNFRHMTVGTAEHSQIRSQQVQKRASETAQTLEFLRQLSQNKVDKNILENDFDLDMFKDSAITLPRTHISVVFLDAKTSEKEDVVCLRATITKFGTTKDRLDLSAPLLVGHSFGGATTLLTLAQNPEFKTGIILDPWMYPIHTFENLAEKITQPLLCINMQTFQIAPNLKDLRKYTTDVQPGPRRNYTLQHSTHENQCDSVHLIGYWLNFFIKKIDPVIATHLNNALIIRFLREFAELPGPSPAEASLVTHNTYVVEGLTIQGISNKIKKIPGSWLSLGYNH